MSKITAFGLFILLLTLSAVLGANAQALQPRPKNPRGVLPQALPVYNLLRAIETSDFNLYVSVHSSEEREKYPHRFDKRNWRDTRENALEVWRDELKIKSYRELNFKFEGNDSEGEVIILRGRKEISRQAVIRERGQWKIKLVEILPPNSAAQQRHAPDAPSACLSCTLRRGAGDAWR